MVPRAVVPVPDKDLIEAPELVQLISNVPLLLRTLLLAIEPDPAKATAAPEAILVAPEYVFSPEKITLPELALPVFKMVRLPATPALSSEIVPENLTSLPLVSTKP